MIKAYDKKAYTGIGAGILTSLVARGAIATATVTSSHEPDPAMLGAGVLLTLAGLGLTVWGCSWYARAKGHHWVWGFLGMASIVGFIILLCFPDNYKDVANVPPELRHEELVSRHEEMTVARLFCFGCGTLLTIVGAIALIVGAIVLATNGPVGKHMENVIFLLVALIVTGLGAWLLILRRRMMTAPKQPVTLPDGGDVTGSGVGQRS